VQHFDFLSAGDRDRLFYQPPQCFTVDDDKDVLAVALGATLYSPGTRPALAADLLKLSRRGVVSAVLCLEDSIGDADVEAAERNVIANLREIATTDAAAMMLFVRVRTPEQIPMIVRGLEGRAQVLMGFVLPKFTAKTGPAFLDAVEQASDLLGRRLFAMPVLESQEIIHADTRFDTLLAVRAVLETHRRSILAVRIGATDFSAAYGLRRARDISVYDIRLLADVIADIVNIFGRSDASGYVISGPVWEYYSGAERMFKPQLRESPFVEHARGALRAEILAKDLDALIREVVLDKANGLTGKTVIHPTHVAAVHALSVVTEEEYSDAADILADSSGGVRPSAFKNKMNESKPHSAWAQRIMLRGRVFGVARHSTSFVELLGAGLNR
jgi:citrate lyase beta subunit